jgi:hypothetical protein
MTNDMKNNNKIVEAKQLRHQLKNITKAMKNNNRRMQPKS